MNAKYIDRQNREVGKAPFLSVGYAATTTGVWSLGPVQGVSPFPEHLLHQNLGWLAPVEERHSLRLPLLVPSASVQALRGGVLLHDMQPDVHPTCVIRSRVSTFWRHEGPSGRLSSCGRHGDETGRTDWLQELLAGVQQGAGDSPAPETVCDGHVRQVRRARGGGDSHRLLARARRERERHDAH
eukprot:1178851-Prorocentrum_minimum.AAC.1